MQIWLSIFIPLLAILLLVSAYAHHRKLRFTRQTAGLAVVFRLRLLMALFQDHRGLSYRVGKGEDGLERALQEQEVKIAHYVEELQPLLKPYHRQRAHIRELISHWQRLQAANLELELRSNFDQHSRLVASTLTLMEDIFHICRLTTQTDAARERSWYKVMRVAEWIGQVRALGAGAIVGGTLWGSDKGRLLTLHKQLHKSVNEMVALGVETRVMIELLNKLEQVVIPERFDGESAEAFFAMATHAMAPMRYAFDRYMEELAASLGKLDFQQVAPRGRA